MGGMIDGYSFLNSVGEIQSMHINYVYNVALRISSINILAI